MKRIGIVDADLIGRKRHRFPNLVCEKISGYYKEKGEDTELIETYNQMAFDEYDEIYVSKVFTDTPVPDWLEETDRIHLGGTGFYFDKAPNLPYEIEHHMPDYHLYDNWISKQENQKGYDEYLNCSIGFMTRGCFRKCGFCVNQKYDHVFRASPLDEFYDPTRKYICLLDDNFLGCGAWREMLNELKATNKPFYFKQGLDERLLTEEKAELLFNSKIKSDLTFAFDKLSDYDLIESKLKIISKYNKRVRFYVLCGYENIGFDDIVGVFRRIELLFRYNCYPFIMLYQSANGRPVDSSEYRDVYMALARWCNQPALVKKKSFREYTDLSQKDMTTNNDCAAVRGLKWFEKKHPEAAARWFDMKMEDFK